MWSWRSRLNTAAWNGSVTLVGIEKPSSSALIAQPSSR